ncbi:hypothetical protein BD626DRAFT_405664 [Schizophyllum amplum]|uniref:DH domain-containing protein n=1 Tax=Schizophyllum amplum TaxID=97359 RepID=A0A550C9K2_9AGAR|nr:hypothetical protein BD626DRAFT_405664 [Auriculariopsis ampla]
MPNFLANIVPQISNTLLALDISANFLSALPPVLAHCANLEELNVAYNPLRVLPVFVAHLTNLRVLIADSTGLATLPEALVDLDRLHTISVRKNKMHMLPSWLCLLPALGTLIVDGNPFQGPWKALVDPLLAKIPASPAYPPSTPMMPLPTSSAEFTYTESDESDDEFPPTRSSGLYDKLTAEEEEQTIMPDRLPPVNWEKTQMPPTPPIPQSPARGLTRTRTTPNRAFYAQNRAKSTVDEPVSAAMSSEDPNFAEREVRRMKSAGDLRRGRHFAPPPPEDAELSRPPLQHFAASSSNLLTSTSPPTTPDRPGMQKRFASVGAAATMGAFGRGSEHGTRRPLTHSMWDSSPDTEDHSSPGRAPGPSSPTPVPVTSPLTESPVDWGDNKHSLRGRRRKEGKEGKDGKEKAGRWGFLKKMSMGKMNPSKSDTPTSRPSPSMHRATPQIDIRFSTMGSFDAVVPFDTPPDSPKLGKKPSVDALRVVTSPPAPAPPALPSPPASANSLLTPTSTLAPKATKRRSFLPLDNPSLSISTPDASPFVGSMTVTNEEDSAEVEDRQPTPSPGPPPIDDDELMRMEEERQRDAYARALRSVMAYLKDMNDLGMSQQPATGQETESMFMTRPRRATAADGTTSPGSIASSEGQLRSTDSIRMNGLGQTMSMAPSEFSQGSGDERKYKDDRGKRAMIVREIVTTERTYVKGLQELMDIYIKPATQHANMLTGVGSNKDPAIVPAPERKIVFGGVEALCSFHKDIFLPALEVAAAPVLVNSSVLDEVDSDGQLSLNVARAVGNTFLKHAAFMRMYSSYINNFDHSVQRVKYWMTERNTGTNSPGSAAAPSSSVAQLAGMGMTISAISGANTDGSVMSGTHPLSTSQRKRIRQFLKRCRMNPRHSQLNLEGYLLLPVQRIPRYKMLLEQLMRSAPPAFEFMDDPIDRALQEISSLANNMNEGKRESESRRKLVQWQARIRGRFPSPLVQPHRRLIMDGPLLLTRVVRKTMVSFDAFNAQGDPSTVQVDCLAPELTPRPLIGILCNDLLVLCRDPSEGQDLNSYVDLWAVLRMQTLPQPASIVHGNSLRLVDNKAILYFDAPSPSDALNWYRAINLHIPASKS